jgi:DeoR/GlpR family transcriptional regulator of sugar metabolism
MFVYTILHIFVAICVFQETLIVLAPKRQELIVRYLQTQGESSIRELIKLLGVSRETVRRDLQVLEEQGVIKKIHGGAVLSRVSEEPSYSIRTISHMQEKLRIGQAAFELIEDGDTIFIDSGTTTLQLADLLQPNQHLTIFTNSLTIATLLAEHGLPVYVLGGLLRPGEMSLSGAMAQAAAEMIHVDKAFIGVGGISLLHGVTDFHLEEVALRRTMIRQAVKTFMLADSSKFGVTALASLVPVHEIHTIISDSHLDEMTVQALQAQGMHIVLA